MVLKEIPPLENYIREPFILINKHYTVVKSSKTATVLFSAKSDLKCYELIFKKNQPCEFDFCPFNRGNFDEINTVYQIGKIKYLIKISSIGDGYLCRFFPLADLLNLIKNYNFEPINGDKYYISKKTFEALLEGLLNEGQHFYVISVNLAKLKYINEVFGIAAGDIVVEKIENRLKELATNYAFKFTQINVGFFLILLGNDSKKAENLEKELLKSFSNMEISYFNTSLKPKVYITTIYVNPSKVKNVQNLYKLVFYAEKIRDDGQPVQLSENHQEEVLTFLKNKEILIENLQKALNQGLLTYHLQPIVKLEDNTISHFEVLMRIKDKGKVESIGKYIALIYEYGLMAEFDAKLLEILEKDLNHIKRLGKPIFINISAEDLKLLSYRKKLSDFLSIVRDKGVKVFFEITEQSLFEEWSFLERLAKDYVLKIAIDDFGSGYSSFKMVIELISKNIGNILKIDASLIKDYLKNPNTRALVDAIITFARESGVETVGEGIENESLLRALRKAGLSHGQGWYLYKPMELKEVLKLV